RVNSCAIIASRVPLIEVLEFDGKHSPLETIHTVVIPDFVVQIFLALRVIAERTRALCYGCVVCDQSAAFAVRAEIFTRIKTETRNFAKLPYRLVSVLCAMRLRGIFDHW